MSNQFFLSVTLVCCCCCLFDLKHFCNASKLELFDSNSNSTIIKTITANTPGFTLGNLNFPISGIPIIGVGCDVISEIEKKKLIDPSLKYIALIELGDGGCFLMSMIFECQKRNWCVGVLFQDVFFDPTGLAMRIKFDKHRNRDEFKVPAVQASMKDFNEFKNLILEENKNDHHNNGTYMIITLTNDPNPWTEMFESVAFLVFFRILALIWSIGCLIFITKILWNQYKKSYIVSIESDLLTDPQTKKLSFNLTLKQVCLLLHWITHISRIPFFIDPIAGQQIYNYSAFIILLNSSIAFEISTNMLLSFVIRELTEANKAINLKQRIKVGYMFITLFLIVSFVISSVEAFQYGKSQFPSFLVLVIFYVLINVTLGISYFWQGYRFYRKCSQLEKKVQKENRQRIILTRISMFNSICMIVFGGLIVLVSSKQVYGTPWGYYCTYVFLITIVQISSLFEVLIFGGIAIDFMKVKKAIFQYNRQSETISI